MSATIPDDLAQPLADWFCSTHGKPTHAQELAVPAVLEGDSVLLSSPTGSGKTLAGFLAVLDDLIRLHLDGNLGKGIQAVYVSPLRALSYDIEKNLSGPLRDLGLEGVIRIGLRNGDTSSAERAKQKRNPPHILLTTPESLAIVLPQKGWRDAFTRTRYLIIDELHALAQNKRGAHLMVSAERIERISDHDLVRVGLSATVAPLEEAARFLVGPNRECRICEGRLERDRFLEVMTPLRRDPYPPSGYTAGRVLRDIAALVDEKGTVLVFCNTRSGAESLSHRLKEALPKIAHCIETHHGSLDRDLRLETEDRLKNGELRAVVCSTSLELGIDIGFIDTVVMISTPKGVSRALQRLGRSGHSVHQPSHGVLVATNINDLIECIVCSRMARENLLDEIEIFEGADDVAAQHLVGMAMEGPLTRELALELFQQARPFETMDRPRLDRVVDYLIGGGRSLENQYRDTFGKLVEEDGVLRVPNQKVQRDYLVNVGTIHAHGMVRVYLGRKRLGEVEESFLRRIEIGDRFVLSGRVVQLIETGVGEVKVKETKSRLPTVPTWNANKMPLSSGLASAVAEMRGDFAVRLENDDDESVADWLVEDWHISRVNAAAVVRHGRNQLLISEIPVPGKILVELFRPPEPDEEIDDPKKHPAYQHDNDPSLRHYFFHTLIGRAANDALSRILVRRVNEAVGGNAMVTIDDYGFLLTLRDFQELEIEAWQDLFTPENAMADLDSALAGSELVKWLFRGVAQTGLMVPRNLPGKERRLHQVRWSSEILFRVLDEHEPDHPMLGQARAEAKHTFLNANGAIAFLEQAADLPWTLREVPVVSPFAFGIYASQIKEGMMMETPEEAIERLYAEFEKGVANV